jgi:hypothetical protein
MKIYMIDEVTDAFRWIGLAEHDKEIGVNLARIKFNAVKDMYTSLKVEWLAEYVGREVCDFPNFRSQFTCMSNKAFDVLKHVIEGSGEFIDLYGLNISYKAFHCLTVYDALNKNWVENAQKENEYFSISSPASLLALVYDKVGDSNIFHIPEVKNKFFVTQHFKDIYDKNELTGLLFREVPLTNK